MEEFNGIDNKQCVQTSTVNIGKNYKIRDERITKGEIVNTKGRRIVEVMEDQGLVILNGR